MTSVVPALVTLSILKFLSEVSSIFLLLVTDFISGISFAMKDLKVSQYIETKCEQLANETFCDYCQVFEDSAKWDAEQIEKAIAVYYNFLDDTFACNECYKEEKEHISQLRQNQNEDSMQLGTDYKLSCIRYSIQSILLF